MDSASFLFTSEQKSRFVRKQVFLCVSPACAPCRTGQVGLELSLTCFVNLKTPGAAVKHRDCPDSTTSRSMEQTLCRNHMPHGVHRDRRQLKTRAAILEAFTSLLARKNFSRITVQDIIDRANIGRTTFYAHFATRDELLKEVCQEMFSHVFSLQPEREETHDFSRKTSSPRSMITHILYHLAENRNNIAILTFDNGGLICGFFQQFFRELASRKLVQAQDWQKQGIPEDFLINHISTSFTGMVQWWMINNRLTCSPEELAGYFMAVTPVLGRGACEEAGAHAQPEKE